MTSLGENIPYIVSVKSAQNRFGLKARHRSPPSVEPLRAPCPLLEGEHIQQIIQGYR
jgi:hypothetical protein